MADSAAATITLSERDSQWVLTGQVTSQVEADRLLELVRGQRRPANAASLNPE